MEMYSSLIKHINANKVQNIAKQHLIEIFHSRFFNAEHYENNVANRNQLDLETNRIEFEFLKDEVIDFCMHTEVCKLLNMSYLDIMQLDFATYQQIKEVVLKDQAAKNKTLEKVSRDMNKF